MIMKHADSFNPRPTLFRLSFLTALASLSLSHADVLVWDANNGSDGAQDGGGTWTAGQPNWLNQTLGLENQSWMNGSSAIIGSGTGAAGTISVSGAITVADLIFDAASTGTYTLAGSGALTLQNSVVTTNAAAIINTQLVGTSAWEKTGAAQLTLGGSLANTNTGTLTVSQGRLQLSKTGGATAVAGDLIISSGGSVTFTGSTTNQINPNANVSMSGAASGFNGTGPNTSPATVNQTLASLTVTGGAYNAGANSNWTIGEVSFLAGENRTFVGNSGSSQSYGSLTLVGMNGVSSSTAVANGYTLFGNETSRRTTLIIGEGGLSMENSRLHLKRGSTANTHGSRVVLNGDVSVAGGISRFEQASSGTETQGLTLLELSGTAGDVERIFTVAAGSTLDIQVDVTNGAASSASLIKAGAGNLILGNTGNSSFTGTTIVQAGTLTLSRTSGGVALIRDVQVNSGGVLTMTQPNQFGPQAGITIQGGTVSAISTAQTFAHFTQLSGGLVTSGNTGIVTVTGALTLAGGGQFTINSFASPTPAAWTVHRAVLSGANILIGGANGVGNPRTSLTIGSGGLHMEGRTITLNRGNAGVVMNLFGNFTGTGNNTISLSGTGDVAPLIHLGAETRVFDVLSGSTTLGADVSGAGGIYKTGPGTLQLTQANSLTGTLTAAGGLLSLGATTGTATSLGAVEAKNGGLFQNGSPTLANNNNVSNRINTAASLFLGGDAGGHFRLQSATAGSHTQNLQSLTIQGGSNSITVLAGTGTLATLTFTSANPYVRQAGTVNFIQNAQEGGSIVFTQAPSGAGNVSSGVLVGATLNGTDLVAAQAGVVTAFNGWTPTGTSTWLAGGSMDVTGSNPLPYTSTDLNAVRFNTADAFTITLDGTHRLGSDVLLVTPQVGANTSTITGGTLTGSAGGSLVLSQFNTSGSLTIASLIANHSTATGLTKTGPGLASLTGANTYSGLTSIEEGVLRAADSAGLPTGSALRLSGGAFESTTGSFTRALGTGAGQVTIAAGSSGFSAFGSTLNLNLGGSADPLLWGSAFFQPDAFVLNSFSANSALFLLNPIDLQGATRSIQVDAQTATLSGGILNTGLTAAGLIKTGAGTLALPGANSYDGPTLLHGGTLALGNDGSIGAGALIMNGGAFSATNSARTLANTITLNGNSSISGNQSITLNGDFTNAGGNRTLTVSLTSPAVLEIAGNVYLSESATASRFLSILGSSTRIISGVIANNAGDNSVVGHLFFNGGGTLTLTAQNTYTGRTLSAGGGYIVIQEDRNLGIAPTTPLLDAIILANNGRIRATSTFTLDANRSFGIGNSGGGTAIGQIDITTGNTLTVPGTIANRTLNVEGTSTPANIGGLTKTGTGVLVLTGENTYSGLTTVSNGILRVGSNNALGSTAEGTSVANGRHLELMDGIVITGETLTLNGGNGTTGPGSPQANRGGLQAAAGATAEWAGPIVLGATNSRIGVQDGGILTLSGDITDGGAGHTLTFSGDTTGTGAVILAGSGNSWGGATNIVRGIVKLGAHNALPTGTTLDIHFSNSNNDEYAGFDLNGFNQTVARLINSGVSLANAELTNSSRTPATMTVNQTVNATYNGIITGNLSLAKTGPAIMILAQPNTYTGGTTVSEGTIRLTNAAALAEGDVTLLGGTTAYGTLDLNNVSNVFINGLSGGAGTLPGLIVNDSTTSGTRTLFVGVNHATSTYSGNIINNNGGTAQGSVGLAKIGTGTLTLQGQNSYTGNTALRNGTLIADFSTQHPLGSSTIRFEGGRLVIANATTATLGPVTLVQSGADYTTSVLRIENGATITTPTFTGSGFAPFVLDLRGGGTFIAQTISGMSLSSDVLVQGGSNRATLYAHDDAGFGFATRNGANEIVRYTGATALTQSNTSNTTNYLLTSSLTRTAGLAYHTLQIDSTSAPVTLTMGANNLTVGSNARSILFTGTHDGTITATTGAFSGGSVFIANHGSGTATLDMSLAGQATIITGPGLVIYSRTNNPADLYVTEGTFRMSGADRNFNTGILRIYGGGILEIGADLTPDAAGDLTRNVGQLTGQVALIGNGGFSAHGADRIVALGGVGTTEDLTWGTNNFLSGPGGDNNYSFRLGSSTSTHTLEFQNNIALGTRQRILEVGDGISSTQVDARLTGILSGSGSIWKQGTGRLEFAGSNTYTGTTLVSAGSLVVTGSTGTGAVTIADGAALLGTGSIRGHTVNLQTGAALHAGASTMDDDFGTLSFHSTAAALFEFQTDSVIRLGLSEATNQNTLDPTFGGNVIGSTGYYDYLATITGSGAHDQLSFEGASGSELIFQSSLHIVDAGLSPQAGQIFRLLDWTSLVNANFSGFDTGMNYRDGSSDDLAQFNLPNLSLHGLVWDISAFTTSGVIVVVPEPSRALLLVSGLALVLLRRRRL